MKRTVIKTLTLLSFVSLMGSFIAYRAGWFGNSASAIQLSPNGSALKTKKAKAKKKLKEQKGITKIDTPRKKKNPRIIPSSKSGRIFRPKKNKKRPVLPSSKSGVVFKPKKKKKLPIMPSSKSGVIFTPKKDTSKKKKATQKKK
ncbi:hypothetical protein [uncultured Microscilla sp.]|uniref:hypothetical protein n=1 Tax=uncultured Microscilla sp. TaxID=432653 RepID=UPI002611749F|nr:hypothetical protein [uncultured Microscilla sp.]